MAMTTAGLIAWAFFCLIPLGMVVAYFSWLWRSFERLGERSTGPILPMTTAGYIAWTLLSLALSAVAVFICWAAVNLLQSIEHNRARGVDQFFIDEERSHALSGGFVGVLFGIGAILAGLVPLRAWRRLRKRSFGLRISEKPCGNVVGNSETAPQAARQVLVEEPSLDL